MRRSIVLSLLVLGLVTGPANAIVYGELDGNRHPNVGAMLAAEPYDDGTWAQCSGTLIAPRVFLTAAHCDDGRDRVAVTFASDYDAASDPEYWGTFHADPAYSPAQGDPHDIAVIVLDKALKITPAKLPKAGSLSKLATGTKLTMVGYGAYEVNNGPGGKQLLYADVRRQSVGSLSAINKAWLRISQNPATGDEGACYGDSGGPNFLGSTNTVAATTITGDAWCRSTNVSYRLDTSSARNFLDDYVAVP